MVKPPAGLDERIGFRIFSGACALITLFALFAVIDSESWAAAALLTVVFLVCLAGARLG